MKHILTLSLCFLALSLSAYGQCPCNNQTSVTYQGYEYDIVEIGGQCWFSENVRFMPFVNNNNDPSSDNPRIYVYGYNGGTNLEVASNSENYSNYGALYNGASVDELELCPSGWHVPNQEDFQDLISINGGAEVAGISLKSTGNIDDGTGLWNSPNSATNSSGFSALPGGHVGNSGNPSFDAINHQASFWSSTLQSGWEHQRLEMFNSSDNAIYTWGNNTGGHSVRCVKSEYSVILGCTYQNAINYNDCATEDDGSCLYTGCMDTTACNYNPEAIEDDGSCDYSCCPGPGCCDEGTYWNEETQTCLIDESFCGWQPDGNADGLIGVEDLLDLLAVYGDTDIDFDGVWDSIDDCLDLEACNYDANPTEPCGFIDALGECGGGCEADADGDDICDDIDDCIGVVDECGVCNGPGATEVVIESITLLYDSVYAPEIDFWFVYETGADTTFSYECPSVFQSCGDLVSHEGYNYSTVQIGDQCWFSENCRYLPSVGPSNEGSETEPYYYVYDYLGTDVTTAMSTEKYETFGVLYNWPAVMTEGICPSGWHIPSDEEFTQLTNFLGGESVAGGKMKEAGYDHWSSPNTGATNSSGWTGLPGGWRSVGGGFHENGPVSDNYNNGYWWTTSEFGSQSWFRRLSYDEVSVHVYDDDRVIGFSARCLTNQLIVSTPGCTDPAASNFNPEATEDDGSCCYGPGGWVQIGESINGSMLNTQLGRNVAMSSSGNIIAVAGGGGSEYFPVRVYENIDSEWTQLGQDLEGGGDVHKVSINAIGNILVIGRSGLSNTGKLSIYEYDENSEAWVQLGGDIIGESGEYYGGYISLSKEMLIVAASFSAPSGENGGVRVFEYSGNEWAQLGGDITGVSTSNILPDNQIPCLSSDGMTIAIGSMLGNTESTGLVNVYIYNGGSWSQIGQTIEGEMSGDESGTSISFSSDGQIMAIGAPQNNVDSDNDDVEWNDAGHVRVFSYIQGYWNQLGSDIDGLQGADHLGHSVSLSNDGYTLAAGAPNSTYGVWQGYTNLYRWDGNNWNQLGESIYGKGPLDYFGRSVALSGDGTKLVVGAPENNDGYGYVSCYSIEFPCDSSNILGCTDSLSCNYNPEATEDDGSCLSLDECGVCGGDGISEGACDCDGNVLDALGVCGGDCDYDEDEDGICDALEVLGCTDPLSDNYNDLATEDDGSCIPYVGMYGYGGVVFKVDGSSAYVLNPLVESLGNTSAIFEIANNISTNGYDDWQVPNIDLLVEACENEVWINLILGQNGGLSFSPGHYSSNEHCQGTYYKFVYSPGCSITDNNDCTSLSNQTKMRTIRIHNY